MALEPFLKRLSAGACIFAGPALLILAWYAVYGALLFMEPPWRFASYFLVNLGHLWWATCLAALIHGAWLWVWARLRRPFSKVAQVGLVLATAVVFAGLWAVARAPLDASPLVWFYDLRPMFGIYGVYQHIAAYAVAPLVAGLISAPVFLLCFRRKAKGLTTL